jgi:pilus assembly protein Flp/PilA
MRSITKKVKNFLVSEDGPTAVEYAIMVALIGVAIIVTVRALGQTLNSKFGQVDTAIQGV